MVTITRKPIKHLYLRVKPSGQIQVSAPKHWPKGFVEKAIRAKQDWLIQQQAKLAQRPVQQPASLLNTGDRVPYTGQPLELVLQQGRKKEADSDGQNLHLTLPNPDNYQARERLLDNWYRRQLKQRIAGLLEQWQARMGVTASDFGVRKMKTRWGSCNIVSKKIWLSLDLIKYPEACLEYVVVHELTHLYERYHNARFYQLMDTFLPNWRTTKERLNRGGYYE